MEVPSILLDSFEFNNWMHYQILCWINHLFTLALHFHWDIYFGCKYMKYYSVDLSIFIWFVATLWFFFQTGLGVSGSANFWFHLAQLDHPFPAFGRSNHRQRALSLDCRCVEECPHRPCLKGCAAEHRPCDARMADCCTICTGRIVHGFAPMFQGPGG